MNEITQSNDTYFLGHPKGLITLFLTEMWERMSFYGMRGLLVLFITLFRVVWRLVKGTPTIDGSAFEKKAAKLGHVLLYISLLAVVFSGYLISTGEGKPISFFDWFDVPALPFQVDQQATLAGAIHEYAAYVLVILALGHGVMAVKHHFIDKRSTLIRMIKP